MTTRERPRRKAPALGEAEEARLQASIAGDPDAAELTDLELANLRPAQDVLPPALYAALTARGRPKAEIKRVSLTLRVDPDVLAAYKADGPGWQARMNAALAKGAPRVPARAKAAKSG
ncbi:BrnA antitoxin family protein [Methylobacterium sp. J-030]|uniref:BrnA antitoxin family protein n=1 Tax=Methylobacterium sp. J-030 TaxID=2836627 RepID=UPI001FB883DD|nr:BrnA antitoxin family protein [Methylobacterium sp. J-030]MCJ2072848.1 BrnA antitoxin family protein [Methylobacterium sp. J-030]